MKLLLIKSQDESSWGSCKVISPNLHELYLQLTNHQIEWFSVPQEIIKSELASKHSSIEKLKNKIIEWKPERIIFIDHLPVPSSVLGHLSLHMQLSKLPPLIFHIYGDFTYFASEWLFLNNELRDHQICFIVASDSQKRLVNFFLEDSKSSVHKLCFPVNEDDYFYSLKERNETREELKLGRDDFMILYSGRISLQKNVDTLIRRFADEKAKNSNLKLYIAGAFDDVGADFLGYSTFHGYMFHKMQLLLQSLNPEIKNDIHFLGHQSKNNLRKLKAGADCFVSLSLYHDEDYGMSPAEALSTGLPSLLTDWGGYNSFANSNKWICDLVNVDITEFGLEIDTDEISNFFSKIIKNKMQLEESRVDRALEFQKCFSIKTNVSMLQQILQKDITPFSGFNWYLEQYSNALSMNWSKSKLNKFLNPDRRSFYFNVYKNYISALEGTEK